MPPSGKRPRKWPSQGPPAAVGERYLTAGLGWPLGRTWPTAKAFAFLCVDSTQRSDTGQVRGVRWHNRPREWEGKECGEADGHCSQQKGSSWTPSSGDLKRAMSFHGREAGGMGSWAHRKLFWPPPPCFPHPRLSHRTAGPPRAQKPHGLRAKPLCQVAVLVCSQVPQSRDPWVTSVRALARVPRGLQFCRQARRVVHNNMWSTT